MVPHVPLPSKIQPSIHFWHRTRCDPIWSKVLFVSIMNTAFILHKVDPMNANVKFVFLECCQSLGGHLLISDFIAWHDRRTSYHRFAWQTQNEAEPERRLQIHWKTSEIWKRSQSWHDDMVWHQKMLVLVRCWGAMNPHLTCPCSKHVMYTAVQYTDKPNHQTLAFQEQNEKGIRPVNNKIAHLQEISYRTHWMDP